MINKAHIGVGIAGKEGMQAARSSDFAIGKFKFLRPLMFIHGREGYRRNAFLVNYIFYKNVLYIVVQYFFGNYSLFSGQPLYEPFIYQLYNITFTGMPIVIYAIFDFQMTKEDLLENSTENYKYGISRQGLTTKLFWQWVFYGCLESFFVLIFVFDSGENSLFANGFTLNFWAGGHAVFEACIILANLTLLRKINNFTGWVELWIVLSVASLYLILGLENLTPAFPQLYCIWEEFMTNPIIWFGIIFVCGFFYLYDQVIKGIRRNTFVELLSRSES
mmetsp:Transcript_39759/g.28732  ORF Transcript_39759/g.28732 Transcript_39759/m.28732 type:complete len:276 (-) Transcript_39759:178-1005(-)